MVSKEVVVQNLVGLHARPATFFIQKSNEFKSGVWVEKNDRRVNAKSLLGVLSLGITRGTKITVITDGADEQEALDALTLLIGANLDDEESNREMNSLEMYDNIDIFGNIGGITSVEIGTVHESQPADETDSVDDIETQNADDKSEAEVCSDEAPATQSE